MSAQMPWKKLKDLERQVEDMLAYIKLNACIENAITGERVYFGGTWDNLAKKYANYHSGSDVSNITFSVTAPQYQLIKHMLQAIQNDARMIRDLPPILDMIFHGGRRSGKSQAGIAAVLLMALARPCSEIWVVGLRKRHGDKFIAGLKKKLPLRSWIHDKVYNKLMLINGSIIISKSAVNYDADRGESLDMLVLDEAAFMQEIVHDTLINGLADRNGICLSTSSPNMFNWFYRIAELASDPDPNTSETVRTIQSRASDNIFVKNLTKRMQWQKKVMSDEAWRQETEGEFLQKSGLVLPQFDKNLHVKSASLLGTDDITADLCNYYFGQRSEYIVGVDYNINPTAGVVVKFGKNGHAWYIAELDTSLGTEDWGSQLYNKISDMSGGKDPYEIVTIIGDASGEYQNPRKKGQSKLPPSAKILRSQGWQVFSPASGSRTNPLRHVRMDMIRSLAKNAAGEVRMWVDPQCVDLINVFREHPLNSKGLPDNSYKGNHKYDAATYPIYRIWSSGRARAFFGFRLVRDTKIHEKSNPREDI